MNSSPSETLGTRTYVGLILAQATNSFNDQAAHIIGNFFACDMLVRYAHVKGIDEKGLITLVTFCFIVPLLIFSPLAGVLTDKYSKSRIVFIMKCLEATFMALGLVALLLPRWGGGDPTVGAASAILMIVVVFLMGTQTAFLVPAKYGMMPEILHSSILSRGNGILEGTSFVSQLVGTAFGGYLYSKLKSPEDIIDGFQHSNVWIAGAILLTLAIAGTVAGSFMELLPSAAPHRQLTFNWFTPLAESFRVLRRSRPLALAVLGIAFAAFMTLYARQSLLYDGETQKELQEARSFQDRDDPKKEGETEGETEKLSTESQNAELRVAFLIALVGLGIGAGSLLAGYLSGHKLELGLVPIGGTSLVLVTLTLAFVLGQAWATYLCLILVGVSAGLYVVPLYTMLQHRAPKESKGNIVAASNFVNVAGGVLAIGVFYLITAVGEYVLTSGTTLEQARASPSVLEVYLADIENRLWIPRLLFAGASLITVGMLVLICRQLPDFFTRSLLWTFSQRHYHLHVEGLNHFPEDGGVILATDSDRFNGCVHIISATDRFVHYYLTDHPDADATTAYLRFLSRLTSTTTIPSNPADDGALESARDYLAAGDVVGVAVQGDHTVQSAIDFFQQLQAECPVPIMPVHVRVDERSKGDVGGGRSPRRARVNFGIPLPPGTSMSCIRTELDRLAKET